MKIVALSTALFCSALFIGCTDNQAAKHLGGTQRISLPKGEKLEIATWKDDSLWYMTRPMREGEKAETHFFREKSSFGVLEGEVIFVEHE